MYCLKLSQTTELDHSLINGDVLARVVVGRAVVMNKVEQWSHLEQWIIARLPLFHCITVVVQVEVLVEFVEPVSTHHVCYCWDTEEGVSGPVHLYLRQAMNAKHKVYRKEQLHLTGCCVMPVLVCLLFLPLCRISVGFCGYHILKDIRNK